MRNKNMDITKAILSILILFIHIRFPNNIGIAINSSARIGVPFFFMVSGYYCCSKTVSELQSIKNKINRTLKLLIFTIIIYFIFLMLRLGNVVEIINWLYSIAKLKHIIYAVFLNMINVSGHIWFLHSLLYVYVIYYFITKFNLFNYAYFLAPILLLLQLILGIGLSSKGIVLDIPISRNFILIGFPFFMFGNFISKNKKLISNIYNKKIFISICIISFFFQPIERFYITKSAWGNDLYVSSAICCIVLFIIIINSNAKTNSNKWLIKMPEFTYIIHPMIGIIVMSIMYDKNQILNYFIPIITLVIVIILYSLFYICMEARKNETN